MPGAKRWEGLACSVRGASHLRSGLPNQDAVRYECAGAGGAVSVLADGHGGDRYVRSEVGANLAVQSTIKVLKECLGASLEPKQIAQSFGRQIVREWLTSVEEDRLQTPAEPLLVDRVLRLGLDPSTVYEDSQAKILLPDCYGCTLLGAFIFLGEMVWFQIGDGEIVIVEADSSARYVSLSEHLLGTETMSLTSPGAEYSLQVRHVTFSETPPALVLLTTDGYPNSYPSGEAFLNVASDMLGELRKQGPSEIAQILPVWLERVSAEGSGDDVSLAMMWPSL